MRLHKLLWTAGTADIVFFSARSRGNFPLYAVRCVYFANAAEAFIEVNFGFSGSSLHDQRNDHISLMFFDRRKETRQPRLVYEVVILDETDEFAVGLFEHQIATLVR